MHARTVRVNEGDSTRIVDERVAVFPKRRPMRAHALVRVMAFAEIRALTEIKGLTDILTAARERCREKRKGRGRCKSSLSIHRLAHRARTFVHARSCGQESARYRRGSSRDSVAPARANGPRGRTVPARGRKLSERWGTPPTTVALALFAAPGANRGEIGSRFQTTNSENSSDSRAEAPAIHHG